MVEPADQIENLARAAERTFADFGSPLLERNIHWKQIIPTALTAAGSDLLLGTRFGITQEGADKPVWQPPGVGEHATNEDGDKLDTINFYFHGSLDQVKSALKKAGWSEQSGSVIVAALDADKHPLSPLYFPHADGTSHTQVSGFSKGTSFDRFTRHHLRVFDTGKVDSDGKPVWAVAASYDSGVKLDMDAVKSLLHFEIPSEFPLKHKIEHITDGERDYVLKTLSDSKMPGAVSKFNLYFSPDAHATSSDGIVYDIRLNK